MNVAREIVVDRLGSSVVATAEVCGTDWRLQTRCPEMQLEAHWRISDGYINCNTLSEPKKPQLCLSYPRSFPFSRHCAGLSRSECGSTTGKH